MKIAVMTMVRDEEFFLPIWYKYYSKIFNREDIYILDNGSDGSTDEYHNVIKCESKYIFDHAWMQNNIETYMKHFLATYDYVVYVDVDEILVPEPSKYTNIHNYVERKNQYIQSIPYGNKYCSGGGYVTKLLIKTFYTTGYEVLSNGGYLDLNEPVFSQRKNWVRINTFYKPSISSKAEKHTRDYKDDPYPRLADPDLYLIHLNRISYAESLKAFYKKQEWIKKWNPRDLPTSKGWQHRMTTIEDFDQYFYHPKNQVGCVEVIPERFKGVV